MKKLKGGQRKGEREKGNMRRVLRSENDSTMVGGRGAWGVAGGAGKG